MEGATSTQLLLTFVVGGVIVPLIVALFGKEPLRKWLLSGVERETTAQSAIIELARDAIRGWREETKAVTRLTDAVQGHSQETGLYYQNLRDMSTRQIELLDELCEKVVALDNKMSRDKLE
jgi:hypothetical protein